MKIKTPKQLEKYRQKLLNGRNPAATGICVCGGTGCRASGAEQITLAFLNELEKRNLSCPVDFKETGCLGFCEKGPLVILRPKGVVYEKVKLEDVPEIIEKSIIGNDLVSRLLHREPGEKEPIAFEKEIPFYKKQMRIVLGANGTIDPTKIDDYIATGGYAALAKVLTSMKPEEVIEEVKLSGLRGRGGGGFRTGIKWESCRNAHGDIKYVICNGDEGDPGAYMDRSILEGNPHSVIEGMIIGAYAIGAKEGYVYVRAEYPLAVYHVQIAIEQARQMGFLGKNILDGALDFDIGISRGGGAFVCGESTALMASIEGNIGEPRAKHIHTVESGLWEKPTNLNNVETWACIPHIITRGAGWFASIGTENSKGTKVFSLVGKVRNTGLVEVPMGVTLREVVFDIGGGILGGKRFKAVQTGGPSGGCIPEEHLDQPVDFDCLLELGSMMGSGGMIVMDEDTCMVDIARYFTNFLQEESCGKCTPCREGVGQMLSILNNICDGKGKESDIELLEELGEIVTQASLCGLGQTAAYPVLSTIRYFRNEYHAHINERRCPAGVCTALVTYEIDPEKCNGCRTCAKKCPVECISGEKKKAHVLDLNKCIKCGICYQTCRFNAVIRK